MNSTLKVRTFSLSGGGFLLRLSLLYFSLYMGSALMIPVLVHFFPSLAESGWITVIPAAAVIITFCAYLLTCNYTVILEPEQITVRWFGKKVRSFPVSEMKCFCSFGNGQEDALCFSRLSLSEIADIQEARLLKSWLKKPGVPFRKQKLHYQEDFAREYLNHLRDSVLPLACKDVILLPMQPELQCLLSQMYPQLPYRNLTGIDRIYAPKGGIFKVDEAICYGLQRYRYFVKMEHEGIRIYNKKGDVSFLPANALKTAVRADIFKPYERYNPHHIPLLLICCHTQEELAAMAKCPYGEIENASVELLALITAKEKILHWKHTDITCCAMLYTEETLQNLLRLYPDISINTISEHWMYST